MTTSDESVEQVAQKVHEPDGNQNVTSKHPIEREVTIFGPCEALCYRGGSRHEYRSDYPPDNCPPPTGVHDEKVPEFVSFARHSPVTVPQMERAANSVLEVERIGSSPAAYYISPTNVPLPLLATIRNVNDSAVELIRIELTASRVRFWRSPN